MTAFSGFTWPVPSLQLFLGWICCFILQFVSDDLSKFSSHKKLTDFSPNGVWYAYKECVLILSYQVGKKMIVLVVCLGGDSAGSLRFVINLRFHVTTGYGSYCATFKTHEIESRRSKVLFFACQWTLKNVIISFWKLLHNLYCICTHEAMSIMLETNEGTPFLL